MPASRASTATLGRGDSYAPYQGDIAEEDAPGLVPYHLLRDTHSPMPAKRLIVAVDFGTTYSAVSYVALEPGESAEYLELARIHSIQNFPDDWNWAASDDRMRCEVPTEVLYPLDPSFREKEDSPAEEDEQEDPDTPPANFPNVPEAPMGDFNSPGTLGVFGHPGYDDEDEMSIDDDESTFRWGYAVHQVWGLLSTHKNPKNQALSRFKLLLDDSPLTSTIRNQLGATLDNLKRRRIVKHRQHVIADFLTCLLRHVKAELKSEGFDDSYRIEMVLCVPAIWTQKACRDMQTAMAKAMKRAMFEGVDVENNSIENLFIVSEPEAAAAYVLARESHISPGDTFVLLDAGGGTVDANTYTVSSTTPLRLSQEVVPPGGGLYGSSYLNEGFRELLENLLADETYLNHGESTIHGCIEKIMINEFEYRIKRSFNYYTAKGFLRFDVAGLRDNQAKRFRRGAMHIPTDAIKEIFLKCFNGIASIMEEQINEALAKGARVEKVVVIGGFAASKSLKIFLTRRLEQFCSERNCHILPIWPEDTATAVASGAVLRAANKEQGPRRYARSSYGILRTEPFGEFPEHDGVKAKYDQHDGLPYLFNTVDWVLKLGQEVPPVWRCAPFLSSHTFDCFPVRPLLCKEVLYVSETSTKSHYQLKHPNNRGAEKVGEIVVDFTFLRDAGIIQPVEGGVNNHGKLVGRRHYKVTYTMVIQVVDRDLECYAIYNGLVMKKCRINIASAFDKGAK